jgi:outer membrane protein assembly factor BamB
MMRIDVRVLVGGLLLGLLVAAGTSAAGAQNEKRTWTSADGQHQIEAEFLEFKDQKVRLRKSDGKEMSVAVSALSKADRDFVRLEVQRRKKTPAAETPARTTTTSGKPAATGIAGQWPRWRNVNIDGKSAETGLLREWPENGPLLVWQVEGIGTGFGGPSVIGGTIFVMGRAKGQDCIFAMHVDDGSVQWSTPVGPGGRERGPNCTPTVDGSLLYGISIDGDFLCAQTGNGKEVWRKNFGRDFGGKMMSGWGYSESPLVDGNLLVCTPGGERAILAAMDKSTGKVVWTTPMPYGGKQGQDGAGYSSIVISRGAGVKQYVTLVGRGVIGVAADTGRLLWRYDRIANGTACIPTCIVSGDYVFCSSGYGDGGTALLKLTGGRGGVSAQEVYYKPANDVQNHHGGMILVGDHVYLGNKHNQGFPLCLNLQTGQDAWRPGRGPGDGSAAISYADGHLYFRYQNGILALIEATPEQYNLKSSFRLPSVRAESWPHPVIADGKLYLRDQEVMMCFNIKAQ